MIKHIKYTSLALGLLLLSATSCSDFLDQEPDERVEVQTEDQLGQLLVSAYMGYNYGLMTELYSDNLIDVNAPRKSLDSGKENTSNVYYNLTAYDKGDDEAFKFEQVKSNSGYDSPAAIWEGCYYSIATANMALEASDKIIAKNGGVVTEKMKALRAEAYLVRAYHHFILVNLFSQAYKDAQLSKADIGVPYVTKPETTVNPQYERGNVADVYDSIQVDLEKGLAGVSDAYYKAPKYHFNVNAAHAFAARFYLYKRDYDKVIQHADAVLGTDPSALPGKLIDLKSFDDCAMYQDFVNVWQSPDAKNNLMLIATGSIASRHMSPGNRYAFAGNVLKETYYRVFPTAGFTIWPAAIVSGLFFTSGDIDYGVFPCKSGEQFEMTDKMAQTGYPHGIRREFTANMLLLERAEAKLLCSRHDIEGCYEDLKAWDESYKTFNTEDMATFGNALNELTLKLLLDSYTVKSKDKVNCFKDWSFTQNMSPEFVITDDLVPFMNCINDFRRMETVTEGFRLFDLKRWGIEYKHVIGLEQTEYKMAWNDPRRAFELPVDVMLAGLASSRPIVPSNAHSKFQPVPFTNYSINK